MANAIDDAIKIIAECNEYRNHIGLGSLKLVMPADDEPIGIKNIVYYRILLRLRSIINTPVYANTVDENNRRRNMTKEISMKINDIVDLLQPLASAPLVIPSNKIMSYYDKYGYIDILKGADRLTTSSDSFYADIVSTTPQQLSKSRITRRYIIKTPEPPLVYNITTLLNDKTSQRTLSSITEDVMRSTKTANFDLHRTYVRVIDDAKKTPEWLQSNSPTCFPQLVNNTLNAKIMTNIKRCGIMRDSHMHSMSSSLLNVLDYYKFVNIWAADGINELKRVLCDDVKEYLTQSFSALNSSVRPFKEVLFTNYSYIIKLSTDVSNMVINNIKTTIKVEISSETIDVSQKQNYMVMLRKIIKDVVNSTSLSKPIESMDRFICS